MEPSIKDEKGNESEQMDLIKIKISLYIYINVDSEGFHSGARPSPPSFVCRRVGLVQPGIEILLLTLEGRPAVGEPVSTRVSVCVCVCVFMGGGLCTLCHAHGARGLAYAAVFMARQTHSELPHGICLAGCVCVCVCV